MKNITYSHEHMRIDLSGIKHNDDCYLNVYEEALDEMSYIRSRGVERIVDCTNHGMGLDIDVIRNIEKETGIKILHSTGFYKDPFLPDFFYVMSDEELCDLMIRDIENGATFIGEIGTSKNEITKDEKRLFEISLKVHKQTGSPIITHTTLGTKAIEQARFFKEGGADLHKIIISHTALSDDIDLIIDLLKIGVNVAFDTIGKLNYLSDTRRIEFIKTAISRGYVHQLFMSMDITRKSMLKKNGGVGYGYLLDVFCPKLLEAGVSEKDLETIMCENIERVLV